MKRDPRERERGFIAKPIGEDHLLSCYFSSLPSFRRLRGGRGAGVAGSGVIARRVIIFLVLGLSPPCPG